MTYQKVDSSIVLKGAMNSFNEMFSLVRMFPLAVMHPLSPLLRGVARIWNKYFKISDTFHDDVELKYRKINIASEKL